MRPPRTTKKKKNKEKRMNKSFLAYVAEDMLQKYGTDLSAVTVVFPNKRASLFMNEWLAQSAGKPVWSPDYVTISDLFRSHSQLEVADQLKLIAELHRSFCHCTGSKETLDRFLAWGTLLLADFDDMDKNMADASKVLANVTDIHALDDLSYLNDEQQAMLKRFFHCFDESHITEMKRRFLSLWSHLHDIYLDFNQRLEKQQLAYEGALYRKVATDEQLHFDKEHYLFVGFNVVQQAEQQLFKRLQQEGKAHFYWDFDHYYMKGSEAGHYISQYLQHFPNELDNSRDDIYRHLQEPKSVELIAASTEDIQARYISQWLLKNQRIDDGKQTAIVLCNEKLLPTIVHCLPEEADKVNITTGYPLQLSPLSSLLHSLFALYANGYVARQRRFRLTAVNKLLRHPYAHYLSPECARLYQRFNMDAKVNYPSEQELGVDEGTQLLFGSFNGTDKNALPAKEFCHWLIQIIKLLGKNLPDTGDQDPFLQEATFRTFTILNRLYNLMEAGDLDIDSNTLQRLITQLMQTTSVPFHGEPAIGLQIMGVLETRNLDFRHVLLLSCNEGNMPKGVNDTSFIPYSIRKAHGLTTIDNKVAIYAYYFYRLLQRAEDITIVYNRSTDNGATGEMSRFVLQLMVESGQHIRQKVLQSGQAHLQTTAKSIQKSPQIMEALLRRFALRPSATANGKSARPLLSPTAINRYQRCPLLFYYHYVLGIEEQPESDPDGFNLVDFGNIFHEAAERVYRRLQQAYGNTLHTEHLQEMRNAKAELEAAVDRAFKKCLFKVDEDQGFTPDYSGLQLLNRSVILTYLERLLEADQELAPFEIQGLECSVTRNFTVNPGTPHAFTTIIGGYIDRLDRITDGEGSRIRGIDYKTGSNATTGLRSTEDIFDSANLSRHSNYYLQAFLYSLIVRESPTYNSRQEAVSPALLFIQHTQGEQKDPTLKLNKQPVRDIREESDTFMNLFQQLLNEMFNPDIPFTPTADKKRCEHCPFRQFCSL